MTISGREIAWVRKVTGSDPGPAQVRLSLDQLTRRDPLGVVRKRAAALLDVGDDVASLPERWPTLGRTHDDDTGRRYRAHRHPFVRHPTGDS